MADGRHTRHSWKAKRMTRSKGFSILLLAGLVFGCSACGFRVPNTNEFFGTMTILCLLRSPLCFDCPYAGSWETVDTYRASAGEASNPTTMVGSGNRMFVAGRGTVGGTANWVVRTSEDGFSWQTICSIKRIPQINLSRMPS